MNELKNELISELAFLSELKDKVWKYHPNNPDKVSVVDEYAQLQMEMEEIEERLDQLGF
tara:strand:+ start:59 stop:235 length:177 start_codon:yes stop_codon:yes gene_type:complete